MSRGYSPPRPPPKDAYRLRASPSVHSFKQSSTPPPPPGQVASGPYDYSLAPPSSLPSTHPDLPEAFRDVVQISPAVAAAATLESTSVPDSQYIRRTPSPRVPAAYNGYASGDMSTVGHPQLPSQVMRGTNQNPFEQDEIEPAGSGRVQPPQARTAVAGGSGSSNAALAYESVGTVAPNRAKFSRTATGDATLPPSPGKGPRVRRSMSSDLQGGASARRDDPAVKELVAGQRRAAEDKKGSRHADVVDRWDPTGLGSAMWHHSGPYDVAAPSRNTDVPESKAPMLAFNKTAAAPIPPAGPRKESTISLADPTEPARRPDHGHRQKSSMSATARRSSNGGGLTGQYSTSMPSSGGYFPEPNEPQDEASIARKERQAQREAKRRALKAAWGIDEPEPYEDFGASPMEPGMDLPEDDYSPQNRTSPLPMNKPLRSPGLRLGGGGGPRTPPIMEDQAASPGEYATGLGASFENKQGLAGGGGGGATGVKRNKSLMQKIKTMREGRSSSPHKVSVSASPRTTPSAEIPPPVVLSGPLASPTTDAVENPFASPPRSTSTPGSVPLAPGLSDDSPPLATAKQPAPAPAVPSIVLALDPDNQMEQLDDSLPLQSRRAPARPAESNGRLPPFAANRVKTLPLPPVGQVMPDFDDIVTRRRGMSGTLTPGTDDEGAAGVKRKTSIVKRLKDRMVK